MTMTLNKYISIGRHKLLAVALCAATCLPAGLTSANDSVEQSRVEHLLEVSGTNDSLQKMPMSVIATLKQGAANTSQFNKDDPSQMAIAKRIDASLSSIVTVPRLKRKINSHLMQELDESMLNEMIAFYESPLGKKVKASSKTSSEAIGSLEFKTFFGQFAAMQKNEKRMTLIAAELNTLKIHEVVSDMLVDTLIASFMGMTDSLSPELLDRMNQGGRLFKAIDNAEASRQTLYDTYGNVFTAFRYFDLRQFSDIEFETYSTAMVSEASIAMHKGLFDAYISFVKESGYEMGMAVGNEISKQYYANAELD